MKTIKSCGLAFAMLASISLSSCEKNSSTTDIEGVPLPAEGIALLEKSNYLHVEDGKQPGWLQTRIVQDPYTKVYHSEKGTYLLATPLEGNAVRIYNNKGKGMSDLTEEQLLRTIQDGQPWLQTHIYSYPMYPGDAEWDFKRYTVEEIKSKLQLPTSLLNGMSTADLIETNLEYPYYLDFLMSEEAQQGVDLVRAEFNGLDELFKRKDLAKPMLRKYEMNLNLAETVAEMNKTEDDLTAADWCFQFLYFKLLVAQDEFLDQLDIEQLRHLIELSIEANHLISTMPELFNGNDFIHSLYLYARVIKHVGGFEFESEEEKQLFDYFAQTCSCDMNLLGTLFTTEMQVRIFTYFEEELGVKL